MAVSVEIPAKWAAPFVSELPPAEDVSSIIALTPSVFRDAAIRNALRWEQVAQARVVEAWATLTDAVSFPPGLWEASEKLWTSGWAIAQADTPYEIARAITEVLGEAWGAIQAVVDLVGVVPIWGWVVDLVFSLVETGLEIWKQVQAEAEDGEVKVDPPKYDDGSDQWWQRRVLAGLNQGDWSALFQPAGMGMPVSVKVRNSNDYNRAWANPEEGPGLGVIPGGGSSWVAWYFDTTRSLDSLRTRAVGIPWSAFRPGLRAAGALAWDRTQTATPQSTRVDTRAVESSWEEWGEPLAQYLASATKDGSWYRARSVFRGPALYGDDAPGEYRSEFLGGEWVPSLRRRVAWAMKKHRKRVGEMMGTLACAYVSENDPVFRDAALKEILELRRRQLLEHPARWRVSLSAVADPEFKDALFNSRMAFTLPGSVDTTPTADPVPLPPKPGTPPGGVPPPVVPPPAFPKPPGAGYRARTSYPSVVPALAMAAALGGFWFLSKRARGTLEKKTRSR